MKISRQPNGVGSCSVSLVKYYIDKQCVSATDRSKQMFVRSNSI